MKLEDGQDCHAQVMRVAEELEKRGWQCWIDHKDMGQDVKASMAQGIEECKCVLIFLSRAYMQKVEKYGFQVNVQPYLKRALILIGP